MTDSVNRAYIPAVDNLRAFAALLVFFYHGLQLFGAQLNYGVAFDATKHWIFTKNPFLAVLEEGHSGVSLFIVLSGFILATGAINRSINYRKFLLARVLRIYPLLILYLVLAIPTTSASLLSLLATLLPFETSGSIASPFTAMFWAVAVEFQCYLIFPFLIAFSNRLGSKYLVHIIAIAIVMRLLAVMAVGVNARDLSYWNFIGRIDQFCVGIILARLYVLGKLSAINANWLIGSMATIFGVLWSFNQLGGWVSIAFWKIFWPTFEAIVWALFIITFISAARRFPRWLSFVWVKLGEISYSFYLVHFVILVLIVENRLYLRLAGNGYYDALLTSLFIALPITIIIARLTYEIIELPFLQLRSKYIY